MIRFCHYKNFCGIFCCLLLMLFCMTPGHAQDNDRKILKKVTVEYPLILKGKGIGGTVRLKVFIKPDGSVREIKVLGGNPILAETAQKSVSQWRFAPGSAETAAEISVVFDPQSQQAN